MQNTIFSPRPKAAVKFGSKVQLNYLHGIRGIAALYVMLFHIHLDYRDMQLEQGVQEIPLWIQVPLALLSQGHAAVAVFILLSGYCLMLPVIKSADKELRGGFWGYVKRRAKRIIPPYYAAILLSLLVTASIPAMLLPATGWHWNSGQPSFSPDVILSHIFLVHNLRAEWMFKIDPPLWSVGLEWQIYLLFPLLLPIWRRFGVVPLLASAFGLSVILNDVLPFSGMITLFTLGMFGAIVGFSQERALVQLRKNMPWNKLSILFFVGFLTVCIVDNDASVIKDFFVGISTLCLIIKYTSFLTEKRSVSAPFLLPLLQSKLAFTLGIFSYSLYLIHAPVLALYQLLLNSLALSLMAKGLLLFTIGPLLVLGVTYVFHTLIEKRFMSPYAYTK
jgi:peptidoglycan/LPS O-acetylase OafA/YrhL